jgi:hypothetical protein
MLGMLLVALEPCSSRNSDSLVSAEMIVKGQRAKETANSANRRASATVMRVKQIGIASP